MINLPVEISGVVFPNPVGMPAGWIDSPDKLKTIHRLGVGIPTIKTITANRKDGNPYPRIIRKRDSMINSLGLPNEGAEWWKNNFEKPDYPVIISIKGNTIDEWLELIDKMQDKADILELNLSCPNVGDGIMDITASADIVKSISKDTKTKLFLKISPEFSPEENLSLIKEVRDHIQGITAINTKPVKNENLGNPFKTGGLSGDKILPLLKKQLKVLRQEYPTMNDLPILATGGISTPEEALEIILKYRSIPMGLTAFLTKGGRYYYKLAKEIANYFSNEKELKKHLENV